MTPKTGGLVNGSNPNMKELMYYLELIANYRLYSFDITD